MGSYAIVERTAGNRPYGLGGTGVIQKEKEQRHKDGAKEEKRPSGETERKRKDELVKQSAQVNKPGEIDAEEAGRRRAGAPHCWGRTRQRNLRMRVAGVVKEETEGAGGGEDTKAWHECEHATQPARLVVRSVLGGNEGTQ